MLKKVDGINQTKKDKLIRSREIVLDSIEKEIKRKMLEEKASKSLFKKVDGIFYRDKEKSVDTEKSNISQPEIKPLPAEQTKNETPLKITSEPKIAEKKIEEIKVDKSKQKIWQKEMGDIFEETEQKPEQKKEKVIFTEARSEQQEKQRQAEMNVEEKKAAEERKKIELKLQKEENARKIEEEKQFKKEEEARQKAEIKLQKEKAEQEKMAEKLRLKEELQKKKDEEIKKREQEKLKREEEIKERKIKELADKQKQEIERAREKERLAKEKQAEKIRLEEERIKLQKEALIKKEELRQEKLKLEKERIIAEKKYEEEKRIAKIKARVEKEKMRLARIAEKIREEKEREEEKKRRKEEKIKLKIEKRKQRAEQKIINQKLRKKKIKKLIQDTKKLIADLKINIYYGFKRVILILLLFLFIIILTYFCLVFLVTKLHIDNQFFRQASRLMPVPAIFTDNSLIEYYRYQDLKVAEFLANNISHEEIDKNLKLKFAREMIVSSLADKYEIKENNTLLRWLEITEKATSDKEINQVPINRITRIMDMIKKDGNFIEAAKFGDEQGIMTASVTTNKFSNYGAEIKDLKLKETTNIITTPEGYYIFKSLAGNAYTQELSYVFVKANDLNTYIENQIPKIKIWSLVD